jgi:hypothetical protein
MVNCDISIWYKKLEPIYICDSNDSNLEKDYWLDIILMIILVIILPFLLSFTRRTFKHTEMQNIHNYIIYSSLFSCIILRMACLSYSLTLDHNKKVLDDST